MTPQELNAALAVELFGMTETVGNYKEHDGPWPAFQPMGSCRKLEVYEERTHPYQAGVADYLTGDGMLMVLEKMREQPAWTQSLFSVHLDDYISRPIGLPRVLYITPEAVARAALEAVRKEKKDG